MSVTGGDSRFRYLGACDVCNSLAGYVEDAVDGRVVCIENGHWAQRHVDEHMEDMDGMTGAPGGRYARKLAKSKQTIQKSTSLEDATSPLQVQLQLLQFILKQQCAVLVHQLSMPESVTSVVQQIWLLYVNESSNDWEKQFNQRNVHQDNGDDEVDSSSESSWSSDDDTIDSQPLIIESLPIPTRRHAIRQLKLTFSLVICYLALLYLKCPVLLSEMRTWALDGTLPYLSAYLNVPKSLLSQINGPLLVFARPQQVPCLTRLHLYTLAMGRLVMDTFSTPQWSWPAVQRDSILQKFIQKLCLPDAFYDIVLRLLQRVPIDLHFGFHSARVRHDDTPDLRLVSVLIVAVKLIYGIANRTSILNNTSTTSSTISLPSWESIVMAQKRQDLTTRPLHKIYSAQELIDMDEASFERYLHYCRQHVLVPTRPLHQEISGREGLLKELEHLAQRLKMNSVMEVKQEEQPDAPPLVECNANHTLEYPIDDRHDREGELPCRYKAFLIRVSGLVHVSIQSLIVAVTLYEHKLY